MDSKESSHVSMAYFVTEDPTYCGNVLKVTDHVQARLRIKSVTFRRTSKLNCERIRLVLEYTIRSFGRMITNDLRIGDYHLCDSTVTTFAGNPKGVIFPKGTRCIQLLAILLDAPPSSSRTCPDVVVDMSMADVGKFSQWTQKKFF